MIGWGLWDMLGLGGVSCSGPGWLGCRTGGLICWDIGLLPGSGDPGFVGGTGPVPLDPPPGREPGSVRVYLGPFPNGFKPPGNGRCPGGYADCGGDCEAG